jgi:minimal CRISPR polymerase domain
MVVGHLDGDDIGSPLELMLLDNKLDDACKYSHSVTLALQYMRDFFESKSAEIIVCGGDDLVACWDAGAVTNADIEVLRNRFLEICGQTLSIGIGSSSSEATNNLRRAKLLGKNRVVSATECKNG